MPLNSLKLFYLAASHRLYCVVVIGRLLGKLRVSILDRNPILAHIPLQQLSCLALCALSVHLLLQDLFGIIRVDL